MKILTCILAMACSGALAAAASETTEQSILTLERRAMDGWLQGNPDESLKLLDPEITLFHSALGTRLVGLAAVRALYETYRGRPLYDRYEIVEPQVVLAGDAAVLTYLFTTQNGPVTRRWHATEVFRRGPSGWRIIHSHFSQVGS